MTGCTKSGPPETAFSASPLFRDIAEESGLKFQHFTGATGEHYIPEIMGPGAALFDYDNDGDLDIYLVQGTQLDPRKKPGDLLLPSPPDGKPGNRLFRNELSTAGKLQFTDVTDQAGVGHVGYDMGVAVGDYDNDGDLDLYVTSLGSNVLYRNNGNGTFREVTRQAGVNDLRWSTSAAFTDYDGDGRLDLYVSNYIDFTLQGNQRCYSDTGELDYCNPNVYRAVPSRLFHNLGNGRFADATASSGIGSKAGPSLGVVCADFDGDGRIDIYEANDGTANFLWRNQGNGTFVETALPTGVATNAEGLPQGGMGVSFSDFDNDGLQDLLVTNLSLEGTVLYRNEGKGYFYDATAEFGLLPLTLPFTGFGTEGFDYDNDSRLDLFIANGAVRAIESQQNSPYPFRQPNLLLHNEGKGRGFRDAGGEAGPVMELSEVSRAVAFGDIDNDGDIDVLLTNNNGPVRLLLNQSQTDAHWLQVRLEAPERNRFGIGAVSDVLRPRKNALRRHVHTDSSYLAGSDVRAHFGLGSDFEISAVVVHWPDGVSEKFTGIATDRVVTLRRGSGNKLEESGK